MVVCHRQAKKAAGLKGSQAVTWLRLAAELGDINSQFRLADSLEDEREAFYWCRKAAQHNHAEAQYYLATMFENGQGTAKDDKQAVEWYTRSAEQGNVEAQFNLACCYEDGRCKRRQTGDRVVQQSVRTRQDSCAAASVAAAVTELAIGLVRCFQGANRAYRCDRLPWAFSAFDEVNVWPGDSVHTQQKDGEWDVVVKVPKDDTLSDALIREWLALSALAPHPNVITMYGLCSDFSCTDVKDGKLLKPPVSFVSKFYPHGSIVDYFTKPEHRGHSARYLVPWAADIASGLAHLHSQKCLHRDLFARNVFISKSLRAVVGDLGLARKVDESKAFVSQGQSAAYPQDVAPEALKHNVYTTASDVFSFGLTLFEIATECKHSNSLFTFITSSTTQVEKLEDAAAASFPTLISKLPAWMPLAVKELMLGCLHELPAKRPTAEELVHAFQQLLPSRASVVSRDPE